MVFFLVFLLALAFLGPFGALPIWVAFSCVNCFELESAQVESAALDIEMESGCSKNTLMVAPKLV